VYEFDEREMSDECVCVDADDERRSLLSDGEAKVSQRELRLWEYTVELTVVCWTPGSQSMSDQPESESDDGPPSDAISCRVEVSSGACPSDCICSSQSVCETSSVSSWTPPTVMDTGPWLPREYGDETGCRSAYDMTVWASVEN
jgi:hypothetical protein